MNTLTFDDLTFEDLAIIRGHMDLMLRTQNISLPYKVFVDIALDKYNRGEYDIIKQKGDFVEEPDMFEEVADVKPKKQRQPIKQVVKPAPKPLAVKVPEKSSNIGKKILIEFDDDQTGKYTLVSNSDEVDADHNKISIHSDLGKVLMYVSEDDVIEFKDRYIRIVEISNTVMCL